MLVGVLLVFKTAHQSAAGAAYFYWIQRQALLLCHFYRNRLKVAEKGLAAKRSAADAEAAEHFGFVSHAYLP